MNWLNDFNEFLEGSILALAKAAWGLLKDAFSVGGLTPEWWATVVGGQVTTVVGGQSSTIDHPGMLNVVVMAMIPVLLIMVVIQVVLSAIRGSTEGMVRAVVVAVFSVPMTYVTVGLIWLAIGATHQLTMWILTVGNSATDGEDEAVAGVLALFGLSYNAQDDSVVMDENYAQWEMALDDGSPGGILVGVLIALVIFLACAVLMAMMIFRLVVLLVLTTFAPPAIFSLALEPAKAVAARWASMIVALLMAAPVAAVIVRMGMVATAMSTDWVQTVAGVVLVFLAAAMPLTMLSMVSFMTGGAGDAVERNAVYAGQGALRTVRHSSRAASARAGRMAGRAGRSMVGVMKRGGR